MINWWDPVDFFLMMLCNGGSIFHYPFFIDSTENNKSLCLKKKNIKNFTWYLHNQMHIQRRKEPFSSIHIVISMWLSCLKVIIWFIFLFFWFNFLFLVHSIHSSQISLPQFSTKIEKTDKLIWWVADKNIASFSSRDKSRVGKGLCIAG